jgi:hypothetical protein
VPRPSTVPEREIQMTDKIEYFRTNDMAMVTFLRLQDHPVQEVFWEAGTCYWRFMATSQLLSDVQAFEDDIAVVNPKRYNRAFSSTKQEFYDSSPNTRR